MGTKKITITAKNPRSSYEYKLLRRCRQALDEGLHTDRTSRRDRDYCDPCGNAASGIEPGQTQGDKRRLPE